MPYPKTLLSAYPPDYFEEILIKQNPKKINVYVDVKNAMTSMFIPSIIEEIALNSKNSGKMDSSIFQSFIFYASWWKKYCLNKNIGCEVHFSTDAGRSYYHNSIYPRYKENRLISATSLTPYDEEFQEVKIKNSELACNVIKKIPGVYFYLLRMLESDFLPYYLITRKFDDPNILHILVSNDHDMYEAINKPNIIQLYRHRGVSKINTCDTCIEAFLGVDKCSINSKTKLCEKISNFDLRYLSSMMAVIGDMGDGVPGVDGIGPKKALDLFGDMNIVLELIGTPDEIEERLTNGGTFLKSFDSNKDYGLWNKVLETKVKKNKKEKDESKIEYFDINELLTNSYKLQSFEQLCRWLEKKDTTSKYDWLHYIDQVLDKHKQELIPSANSFMKAASTLEDNYLTESDLSVFYE